MKVLILRVPFEEKLENPSFVVSRVTTCVKMNESGSFTCEALNLPTLGSSLAHF